MKAASIPLRDPRWRDFTASHPDASPFHLPAWASLIADCYGFDSFALVVCDTDGEILAGLPTLAVRSPLGMQRWVSLPFSDSCPMLVRPGVAAHDVVPPVRELVLASRTGGLEVRASLPVTADVHPVEVGYRQFIDLPSDPGDLRPKKNHRNARNRALRNGVQVVRGRTREDVASYYRLHALTRRRLGVPVQPRRFFDLIYDRIIKSGQGFVATARLDNEVVAAGLYLAHNRSLVAKFGASDPGRQDTGAGYLIDWETMCAACVEGYRTLDLGRTDADAEGLRLYKSGWGAVEEPLVYTHVSRQPPTHARPHVGGLSRGIISHSPLWVGRALGELLYRWSA